MFCSFRTSAPPPTPAASASATNSAVCKTPLAGCVSVRADASKWHRGLFGNGSRKSAIERNTPRTAHNYTYQRHYAASILQQRKKLVVTSSDTTTKNTINPTATITTITTKTNTPKSIANSTPTTAKFNVAANCLYASKCKPSCWTYLVRYKRHFRMPFIISVLAILVNLPAFFEIMVLPCYSFPDYRLIYKLQVSHFRLNDYYKFWYRMVFRMLVTTCGPNIFILCLTVLTVVMLRGTNRSRQRLFHNNELAIEQYSSSLTFMLDIWEVAFGFKRDVHRYLYAVDVSNFLIIFNSSTNCLIIYGFSRWLHHKISARNLEKRERQQCLNSINTKRRTMLMHDSWMKTIKLTHRQFGNRILYAMLLKNPQMFAPFRSDGAAAAHDDETSAGGGARYVTTCSAAVENAVAAATAPADEDVHNFGISNSNCAAPHTEALMEAAEEHDSKAAERAKLLPSITLTTYLTDDEHNGNDRISQADEKEARDEFEPRNENRASSLRVSSDSETHKSPIVGASRCTLDVEAAAAATLSVIPKKKKRSIDLLLNAKFYAFGEQIFQFFDQLIQLMQQGSNEQAIIAKIQYVGKVHYNHGITFTSSAWKEFKTTALSIFADCEYASDEDRTEALEAWSAFLSIIIHNMKLGMWNDNNCYSVYNNNTNNANSFSNNNSHYSASYCNSYGYDQRNNKGTPR